MAANPPGRTAKRYEEAQVREGESMNLRTRVANLEKLRPPPPPPPPPDPEVQQRMKRFKRIHKQFVRLAGEAERLMTCEEIHQLYGEMEKERSSILLWLDDLLLGRCRLPSDLSAEVMKALLLAYASPHCDDQLRYVCIRCGMEYPHAKKSFPGERKLLPGKVPYEGPPPWFAEPDFFTGCPSCGASPRVPDVTWSCRVAEDVYPWMAMEGCVGQPKR
jgi:hypothetical protein